MLRLWPLTLVLFLAFACSIASSFVLGWRWMNVPIQPITNNTTYALADNPEGIVYVSKRIGLTRIGYMFTRNYRHVPASQGYSESALPRWSLFKGNRYEEYVVLEIAVGWPFRQMTCHGRQDPRSMDVTIYDGIGRQSKQIQDPWDSIQVLPGRVIWSGLLMNASLIWISIVVVRTLWLVGIRRFRVCNSFCYNCGYSMLGVQTATCPECGVRWRGSMAHNGGVASP